MMKRFHSSVVLFLFLTLPVFFLPPEGNATPNEADLARLNSYRERYGIQHAISRIQSRAYDADRGFRFVVLGDVRSNRDVFARLWAEIQNEDAVFAILTGDLVQHGFSDEWLNYFLPIVETDRTTPFLPVVGNHDTGNNGMEFKRLFGAVQYSFDYGSARFVIVNNNRGISKKKSAWIRRQLVNTEKKLKFVFAHQPPESISKWAYHAFSVGSSEFCGLMERMNVHSVFLGHIHAYSTARYRNVNYIISGGGGAGLHNRFGPLGNIHHYCVVTVKGNEASHEVVRLIDGKIQRSPGGNDFYEAP